MSVFGAILPLIRQVAGVVTTRLDSVPGAVRERAEIPGFAGVRYRGPADLQ
jgi:hypothetical protein